jgi:hypothetical protein
MSPITRSGQDITARLTEEAAAWDDEAASAGDSHLRRIRAEARRDNLRDVLRWLPDAIVAAEVEAQQDEASVRAWLDSGAGVAA